MGHFHNHQLIRYTLLLFLFSTLTLKLLVTAIEPVSKRHTEHTKQITPTRWAHVQRLQTMYEEIMMRESKQIQAGQLALPEQSEITIKSLCLKWLWS